MHKIQIVITTIHEMRCICICMYITPHTHTHTHTLYFGLDWTLFLFGYVQYNTIRICIVHTRK